LIEIQNNFCCPGLNNFGRTLIETVLIAFVFSLFVWRNGTRIRCCCCGLLV
jgi:hypothetical protein